MDYMEFYATISSVFNYWGGLVMEVIALFGIVNILIYIGIAVIGIYVVFTIIRSMKTKK